VTALALETLPRHISGSYAGVAINNPFGLTSSGSAGSARPGERRQPRRLNTEYSRSASVIWPHVMARNPDGAHERRPVDLYRFALRNKEFPGSA
jgi:hypothetical protein